MKKLLIIAMACYGLSARAQVDDEHFAIHGLIHDFRLVDFVARAGHGQILTQALTTGKRV